MDEDSHEFFVTSLSKNGMISINTRLRAVLRELERSQDSDTPEFTGASESSRIAQLRMALRQQKETHSKDNARQQLLAAMREEEIRSVDVERETHDIRIMSHEPRLYLAFHKIPQANDPVLATGHKAIPRTAEPHRVNASGMSQNRMRLDGS